MGIPRADICVLSLLVEVCEGEEFCHDRDYLRLGSFQRAA